MANVQIADIYNPLTFGTLVQERQTALNRFLNSGIAVMDGVISGQISQGGNLGEITGMQPLTVGEPNYSNDDPSDTVTHAKIAKAVQAFRVAQRNKSWSTMDVARELALVDPLGAIVNRVAAFWATDNEKRIIQSLLGVLADNVANDSGDMVKNVATDSASAITDDERISGDVVIDALQTLGDHKENITAIAVHSKVHARLQKAELIDYVTPAGSNIGFPTYLGKRLIVDDSLPAVSGTNRITYTCILFGSGVIGSANGRVLVPSEIERVPNAGNGGGYDVIYSRVSNVWHPYGFTFTNSSVTNSEAATYTQLATAANWNRVWDRKNIPLAFLKVND
jgi:hypothetical protein